MENVINWTMCAHGDCKKYPTYGVPGSSKRQFCVSHAPSGMVDVHRKKCRLVGCSKRATYGVLGLSLIHI